MNEHILNTLAESAINIAEKLKDLLPASVVSTTNDRELAEKRADMLIKTKLMKKD